LATARSKNFQQSAALGLHVPAFEARTVAKQVGADVPVPLARLVDQLAENPEPGKIKAPLA
jgi:hypothetical protein